MAAPFVVKRSWQAQAELHQHWPSLDLTRVCLVGCAVDAALSVLGSSCLQHGRELIKHLGLRGMYRGGLFGTLALLPGHCLWYMAYEGSKWHLTPRLPARMAPAAAAALAECCWVVSSMPVENVVVRLQCRPARAPPLHWGASLLELRALYQEGGLRRWWNGSVLGLAASLPQSALWWMVYENSKSFLLPHPPTGEQDLTKQSVAAAGAAVAASCASTFILNPLDVVKSQIQASSGKAQATQAQAAHFRQPVKALFLRGLVPRLLLSAISGISESMSYEAIMHLAKPGTFAEVR
ncbi:unnamed protein product [Durusdinium trenchii]|uniref:Uncharacterized protein n=1 Tax=Durusdinium trenchii TaxID=1381693 RepID=A0ABP0LKC1_9DINO